MVTTDTNQVYYDLKANALFTVKSTNWRKIILGGGCRFLDDARTCTLRFSTDKRYFKNLIPVDENSEYLILDETITDAYRLKSADEYSSFYGNENIKYMHMASVKNTGGGMVNVIYTSDWCHWYWNYSAKGYKKWGLNYYFSKPVLDILRAEEHFVIYFGKGEMCFTLKGRKPIHFENRKGKNFFKWLWASTDICWKITVG